MIRSAFVGITVAERYKPQLLFAELLTLGFPVYTVER
jgi:hypothetical protein